MVRGLVYQPSGPGFDSWHVSYRVSYYKGKNPNDAAATYLIFVNYMQNLTSYERLLETIPPKPQGNKSVLGGVIVMIISYYF